MEIGFPDQTNGLGPQHTLKIEDTKGKGEGTQGTASHTRGAPKELDVQKS